jgi:hypothetical protein
MDDWRREHKVLSVGRFVARTVAALTGLPVPAEAETSFYKEHTVEETPLNEAPAQRLYLAEGSS